MGALPCPLLTIEQYLELDRCSERHSEFHDGEMFPIETSGLNHGRIGINLTKAIDSGLENKPCQLIGSTVRVRIPNSIRYAYPDLIVACGVLEFEDQKRDTLLNPTVLIEILSPSTEGFDRGEKFALYRTIPSFQEYILVSQNRVLVERFRRQNEHNWHFEEITDLDASLRIESLGIAIPAREIYARIEIPTGS